MQTILGSGDCAGGEDEKDCRKLTDVFQNQEARNILQHMSAARRTNGNAARTRGTQSRASPTISAATISVSLVDEDDFSATLDRFAAADFSRLCRWFR